MDIKSVFYEEVLRVIKVDNLRKEFNKTMNASIEFINNKAKEYSKEVFDTDKLDFQLDGNSISISYTLFF